MKARNIQVIIYLAILLLFTNHAWAADWIFFTQSETGNNYYDKSTIEKVNKTIGRVLTKTIYNEGGKKDAFSYLKSIGNAPDNADLLSHELVLFEFDCVNKKNRISSILFYDKKGEILYFIPKTTEKMTNIPHGTDMETLKNIVCSAGKTSKTKKK